MKLEKPLLLAAKGGGSTIIEAQFAITGFDCDIEYFEWDQFDDRHGRLKASNPLCEVPTLMLPDGAVMTESAAITLWLGERYAQSGLVPPPGHAQRAIFLRWLIWLVAAVYPTFTYGDHPERYVSEREAMAALRASTDARREAMWPQFEQAFAPAPYLLGDSPCALDLYVAVMTSWRPRREWFRLHCPKLHAVAAHVLALPELQPVWQRNGLQ